MDLITNLKQVLATIAKERNDMKGTIGTLSQLSTTAKNNLVAALNELHTALPAIRTGIRAKEEASDSSIVSEKAIRIGLDAKIDKPTGVNDRNKIYKTNEAGTDVVLVDLKDVTGIDDTAKSAVKTYSSNKIEDLIVAAKTAVKNDLTGGASEAFDTLKELETALKGNDGDIATILTAQSKRVAVTTQTFTTAEKGIARANIDTYGKGDIDGKLGDMSSDLKAYFEEQLSK